VLLVLAPMVGDAPKSSTRSTSPPTPLAPGTPTKSWEPGWSSQA